MNIALEKSGWAPYLQKAVDENPSLFRWLKQRKRQVEVLPKDAIFNSLLLTPFNEVKVVILGDRPHGRPGDDLGLAYGTNAVHPTMDISSLIRTLDWEGYRVNPSRGYTFEGWAEQGVLMINMCLTCESGKPGVHVNAGWGPVVQSLLGSLVEHRKGIVFMAASQAQVEFLDHLSGSYDHLFLKSSFLSDPHLGTSGTFKEANEFLGQPIDWTRISKGSTEYEDIIFSGY